MTHHDCPLISVSSVFSVDRNGKIVVMKLNDVYDKRLLMQGLFGLLSLVVAMKVTGGAGFLLIIPFILMGFSKNKTGLLLWCILATTVITMTNPNIAPKDSTFSIANRLIYLLVGGVMVLQVVGQRASKLVTPLLAILPYVAYMAMVSSVGWLPIISYLKLTLFTIIFFSFYSVGNASARSNLGVTHLRSIFLCFAVFLIIGSVCLIPFPGVATMSAQYYVSRGLPIPEGSLFMGMTLHSQALGPIIAVLSVMLLADLLFSVKRWDWLYGILLFLSPVLIYKTGARTAMGTYAAGIFFVTLIFMHARGVGVKWTGKVLSVLILIGMLGGLAFMATPTLRQGAVQFIFKSRGAEVAKESQTMDNLISSRQGGFEHSMANFRESPWIGNGFQVSSKQRGMKIYSWKQLLSAPIEKGVWVSAVLEEGGVFGMILFCLFLLIAFYALLTRHAFIGATVLFVFIVSNLGEFTFFSMSAGGGLMWSMVFFGVAMDAARLRQERLQRMAMVYVPPQPMDWSPEVGSPARRC